MVTTAIGVIFLLWILFTDWEDEIERWDIPDKLKLAGATAAIMLTLWGIAYLFIA